MAAISLTRLQRDILERGPGTAAALGNVEDGVAPVRKFGSNADIETSYETLWPEGGLKTYRTTATTMTVSSANTADTSDGTGLRTVTVYGVDANWVAISETVTMAGQSAATTTKSFMIVHRMVGEAAGSGGTNAGIVYIGTGTITNGKPAVVECLISAGEGQTECAWYPVPRGFCFLVKDVELSGASNKTVTVGIYVKPLGGIFNLKGKRITDGGAPPLIFRDPLVVQPQSIIEVRAKVDSTSAAVAADFQGILIPV